MSPTAAKKTAAKKTPTKKAARAVQIAADENWMFVLYDNGKAFRKVLSGPWTRVELPDEEANK